MENKETTNNEDSKNDTKPDTAPVSEGEQEDISAIRKKKKKKLVIIALAGTILLVSAVVGFFLLKKSPKEDHQPKENPQHAESSAENSSTNHAKTEEEIAQAKSIDNTYGTQDKINKIVEIEKLIYFELEDFIINLVSESNRANFLKMKIALRVYKDDLEKVKIILPSLREAVLFYLRGLKIHDLQGASVLVGIKQELLHRLNKISPDAEIYDLSFIDFIVQY